MKRMFDKEEIVEIAKEEGGSVTVDSELSSTSENPVQNKVIYDALADKQDSLPDTTGQTDKYLKVGADGLEWAEAGVSGKYLHNVRLKRAGFLFSVINNSNEKLTREQIATILYTNNHTSSSSYIQIFGIITISQETDGHKITQVNGVYASSSSATSIRIRRTIYSITANGVTSSTDDEQPNSEAEVVDTIIPL